METIAPLLLYIVIPIITGALAMRKGYNFFLWLFAAGILGLIVLSFLPFANKPELPAEEQSRLKTRGNIAGGVFAGLTLLGIIIRFAGSSSTY